jgi:hypothetical protein
MLENCIEKTLKIMSNDFSKNHHVCIAIWGWIKITHDFTLQFISLNQATHWLVIIFTPNHQDAISLIFVNFWTQTSDVDEFARQNLNQTTHQVRIDWGIWKKESSQDQTSNMIFHSHQLHP